jgi:hypothetical protein
MQVYPPCLPFLAGVKKKVEFFFYGNKKYRDTRKPAIPDNVLKLLSFSRCVKTMGLFRNDVR